MEPHYDLPFRSHDTKNSQGWLPTAISTQPAYAVVLPEQYLQAQQHQHQQHSRQQQELRSIQQHTAPHYNQPQYHTNHQGQLVPNTVLSYDGQSHEPYDFESYPMIASQTLMTTSPARIELPMPSHILPSQSVNQGPCLACGKQDCQLLSHRYFSKQILNSAKKQQPQSSSTERTPRARSALPATTIPVIHSGPVMATSIDAQRERLLGLWSTEWSPRKLGPERHLFPTKFIDRILPAAQAHPPLLQALLAYSGTMWALANDVHGDVASRQQAFAVGLLSQACPTEQDASTDEGMLAATFLLLVYMAQGNGLEVSKHISGLVHLAKIRGGPHYLGLSGLVAEVLIHADHMQAIFFNHVPIWPLPLPPLQMGLPEKFGRGFRRAAATHELDRSLGLAAASVCKVADVFEFAELNAGTSLPNEASNGLSYLSTISEYQLAQCNATYHASSTASECVCLALILFNHVVLRNNGAITPAILQVEYQLWQALETAEAKGITLDMLPCFYMWLVITALTINTRRESHYWRSGIEKLRTVRIGAGISTWEHFRTNVLDEFVWLPSAQEELFRSAWLEVESPGAVAGIVKISGT